MRRSDEEVGDGEGEGSTEAVSTFFGECCEINKVRVSNEPRSLIEHRLRVDSVILGHRARVTNKMV